MNYNEFKEKFNIKLNFQQDIAVKYVDGATLLLAVPGSGKTTVIVTRLGYMLYCKGIDPSKILTMTYTVDATNDMRKRFASVFGSEYADKLEFRTINGVCTRIIMYYSKVKNIKSPTLVTNQSDIARIIRDIYLSIKSEYPTENDIKAITLQIAYCKNMMYGQNKIQGIKVEGIRFFDVYKAYTKYMTDNHLMDYDDQLVMAWQILNENPDVLEHFRDVYHYINVDEAQDTSYIQHRIIELLAKGSGNIYMVGDEDQSIYGFRAAYPQALMDFKTAYDNARVLLMEQNYRSSGRIVEAANAFIKRNNNRYDKNMKTDRSKGSAIKFTCLAKRRDQSDYIVKRAKKCIEAGKQLAILYRNNDSIIPVIDLLDKTSLPYRCRGVETLFFTHPIVKDVSDIIRFAYDPTDVELFMNIFYKLNMGIKKVVLAEMLKDYRGKKTSTPVIQILLQDPRLPLWCAKRFKERQRQLAEIKLSTSEIAINKIFYSMGYMDYLDFKGSDSSCSEILLMLASQNPNISTFIDRLNALKEKMMTGGSKDKNCPLILSTIHSSKGLEYNRVIMMDLIDDIFPSVTEDPRMDEEDLETLEEERRLFFVGITRAKQELELLYIKNVKDSTFVRQLMADISCTETGKEKADKKTALTQEETPLLKFTEGDLVRHKQFGEGVVVNINDDIIAIRFIDNGMRKLSIRVCCEVGLLEKI